MTNKQALDAPAFDELERRLINLGNALEYNNGYPRKNIMEDVDLIRKQIKVIRSNLENTALTQPNQALVEVFSDSCVACGNNACNAASNMDAGVCFYDGSQRIIHNKCLVKLCLDKQQPVNKTLLDALEDIREHTNADDPDSYRCDDREGCLDTVYAIADKAIAAASSAPVVEVENNIKLLCHECGKTHEHEYNKPPRHGSCEVCGRQSMLCTRVMTEAARLQLERQKMGGI